MSETLQTKDQSRLPRYEAKDLRVKTEVVRRWYVTHKNDDHYIYGGPFYTKQEAQDCLKEARNG